MKPLFILISCLAVTAVVASEVGPLIGTTDATSAHFLYRPATTVEQLRLRVTTAAGSQAVAAATAQSLPANNHVAKFAITGLQPATGYRYVIEVADNGERLTGPHDFSTATRAQDKGRTTAVFVSCASSGPSPLWPAIAQLGPDALFLCGDTPYVDTSNLNSIRAKHSAFLRIPELAKLVATVPTMGVWDDHDFGKNNGNGANFAAGKANTRRGFVEHRAHAQYGTGKEGVYHKVNLGPVEVFLLDPRWFSQTEPSPIDPKQRTCFGKAQWQWLLDGLQQSTATFKVLAMGAIWQDKKNTETDDMYTYWYERDALLDFIRDQRIPGVCLLGGDIHLARHLIHPKRVGYDLHDFVISPGHNRVIPKLNVYNPDLEWSLVRPHQFLAITADTTVTPPRLTAAFHQPNGVVNRVVKLNLETLTPPAKSDHLRVSWDFDSLTNQGTIGERADLRLENGAGLDATAKLHGKALRLQRDRQQYAYAPRSVLYENSATHSISLWFRPASLPQHATSERQFLFETTATGKPSDTGAWTLSCGLRSTDAPDKVNLQLYTHTLKPAAAVSAAPTAIPQGPFDCAVSRDALLAQWHHLAVTFDSKTLRLYLNGKSIATHQLPVPGPASEHGGLVLGGHRAGTGRNFDGLLDEVGIWSRTLSDSEVRALHDQHANAAANQFQ